MMCCVYVEEQFKLASLGMEGTKEFAATSKSAISGLKLQFPLEASTKYWKTPQSWLDHAENGAVQLQNEASRMAGYGPTPQLDLTLKLLAVESLS